MESTGASIYESLQAAQASMRQGSLSLRRQWSEIQKHLDELVSRRTSAIVELAQLYLPTLNAESVQSSFAEVRTELQQILDRQRRQISELTGRKDRLEQDLVEIHSQIADMEKQLASLAFKQNSMSEEVARQLSGHEEFQRLSARVLQTEGELKRVEQRGAELQEESRRKLPPYQSNQLFQYLQARQYGTENYRYRGWTRRMDRWLARLIDYPAARRSYEYLTRAPELFAREIERRKQEFQLQMEQMETIEEAIADQVGLTGLLHDCRQIEGRKVQLSARAYQIQKMMSDTDQQLLAIGREGGMFYQEALQRLSQFLDRTATSVLQVRASQTPTPIDDEIVSRIGSLNRDLDVTRPKIEKLEEECQESEARIEGMDFVLRRFTQSNFGDSRSRFQQKLNLDTLVQQFRAGVLTKDAFWEAIRDFQRFEPTPLEQQAVELAMHPMTGVLLDAMLRTAGAMAGDQVQRSIHRRTTGHPFSGLPGGTSPPAMQLPRWERSSHVPPGVPFSASPAPAHVSPPPQASPTPSPRPHGYSSGKGF